MVWRNQFSSSKKSPKIVKNRQNFRLTERFIDRQVRLDMEHGGAGNLGFFENVATSSIEHTIDTSDSVFGTLKNK